jgi:hypothetical protein
VFTLVRMSRLLLAKYNQIDLSVWYRVNLGCESCGDQIFPLVAAEAVSSLIVGFCCGIF